MEARPLGNVRAELAGLRASFARRRLGRALLLGFALASWASILVMGIVQRGEPLLLVALGIGLLVVRARIDVGMAPRVDGAALLLEAVALPDESAVSFALDLRPTDGPGKRLLADPFGRPDPPPPAPIGTPIPEEGMTWYENAWLTLEAPAAGGRLTVIRRERLQRQHYHPRADVKRRRQMSNWTDVVEVSIVRPEAIDYRSGRGFVAGMEATLSVPDDVEIEVFAAEGSAVRVVLARSRFEPSVKRDGRIDLVSVLVAQLYDLVGAASPLGVLSGRTRPAPASRETPSAPPARPR